MMAERKNGDEKLDKAVTDLYSNEELDNITSDPTSFLGEPAKIDEPAEVGEPAYAEEIVLGDEFDETASVIIPRKTNHQYDQISKFKGINYYFTIFNEIYLHQTVESFRNKNNEDTRINLTYIDAEPIRKRYFAWNYLYGALATLFFGALLIYLGGFEIARPYMLPAGIVLFTAGINLTLIFFYRTQDKIIYHSFAGDVPLIELFHKPKQSAYTMFIDILQLHIVQAQQRQGLTMKQRLKIELSDLRRLSEEGVITVDVYKHARGLILQHKGYH